VLIANQDVSTSECAQIRDRADVTLLIRPGAAWPSLIESALTETDAPYIAAFNPHDYYGSHYLTDYAHATLYYPHGGIGKARYYRGESGSCATAVDLGAEYHVTPQAEPWTLCLPRQLARTLGADVQDDVPLRGWLECVLQTLGGVYAPDRFNYVQQNPLVVRSQPAAALGLLPEEARQLEPALA
jgi:hypothetical protein